MAAALPCQPLPWLQRRAASLVRRASATRTRCAGTMTRCRSSVLSSCTAAAEATTTTSRRRRNVNDAASVTRTLLPRQRLLRQRQPKLQVRWWYSVGGKYFGIIWVAFLWTHKHGFVRKVYVTSWSIYILNLATENCWHQHYFVLKMYFYSCQHQHDVFLKLFRFLVNLDTEHR